MDGLGWGGSREEVSKMGFFGLSEGSINVVNCGIRDGKELCGI